MDWWGRKEQGERRKSSAPSLEFAPGLAPGIAFVLLPIFMRCRSPTNQILLRCVVTPPGFLRTALCSHFTQARRGRST